VQSQFYVAVVTHVRALEHVLPELCDSAIDRDASGGGGGGGRRGQQ
jgi:hypothetical protein